MRSLIGMGFAHCIGGIACGAFDGWCELATVQVVGGLTYFALAAALTYFGRRV